MDKLKTNGEFEKIKTKTFTDNEKYFKFANQGDIKIISVEYIEDKKIQVKWVEKIEEVKN